MKIESIVKREGGTVAVLEGREYHFKPQADGRHIANVTDKKHIALFLRVVSTYKIADDEDTGQEEIELGGDKGEAVGPEGGQEATTEEAGEEPAQSAPKKRATKRATKKAD